MSGDVNGLVLAEQFAIALIDAVGVDGLISLVAKIAGPDSVQRAAAATAAAYAATDAAVDVIEAEKLAAITAETKP